MFRILIDPISKAITGFVVPNTLNIGKEFRIYHVKVREIEKLAGLNFNPQLTKLEADQVEAVDGGDWLMPKSRSRTMDY